MTNIMLREMQIQMANGASFDDAYTFVVSTMEKENKRAGKPCVPLNPPRLAAVPNAARHSFTSRRTV